jgi:hypothetical protein
MRIQRPFWLCLALSVLAVLLLYWPASEFNWWRFHVQGPSTATGGIPVYVLAPVAGIARLLVHLVGRHGIAVGEAVRVRQEITYIRRIVDEWCSSNRREICRA